MVSRNVARLSPKMAECISNHPCTSEMVLRAVSSLKVRGGSSFQAIKKYIAANWIAIRCHCHQQVYEDSSSFGRTGADEGQRSFVLLQITSCPSPRPESCVSWPKRNEAACS